jgi:hypothetical protein
MANDRDIVNKFLNMVRGSLDAKTERLLQELRLQRPIVLNRLQPDTGKPSTPQKDDDQKGTDGPWALAGQSSQDPVNRPPPRPRLQPSRAQNLTRRRV